MENKNDKETGNQEVHNVGRGPKLGANSFDVEIIKVQKEILEMHVTNEYDVTIEQLRLDAKKYDMEHGRDYEFRRLELENEQAKRSWIRGIIESTLIFAAIGGALGYNSYNRTKVRFEEIKNGMND